MLRALPYTCALAFDPGDSTGVMAINTESHGTRLHSCTMSQKELFEFLTQVETAPFIFYEQFICRPSMFTKRQIAAENVGAIKFWAKSRGLDALSVSPAQTHKIRREDLKSEGWTWGSEHEFDAIRILVYGLTILRYR